MSWDATKLPLEEAVQKGEVHVIIASSTGPLATAVGVPVTTPTPVFAVGNSTSSTGPLAMAVAPGALFRLLRVEMGVDDAPSDSEAFTVNVDAGDGDDYDNLLYTEDLSVAGTVDLAVPFGKGYEYEADDEIDVEYANTGNDNITARVVYELI